MTGYNGVYRGTNPYLVIKFKSKKDFDFNGINKIWVTISAKSGSKQITKEKKDLTFDDENKKIYVPLTQEDTLSFPTGKVDIQVRILFKNGSAIATKILPDYPIKKILKEGVI